MIRLFALLALCANLLFAIVNINSADAKELATLKGIGAAKAEAIIEWRNANGAFKSIDELTQVKGVGAQIFEGVKDEIVVEDASEAHSH
jgi:competence protein ComEA